MNCFRILPRFAPAASRSAVGRCFGTAGFTALAFVIVGQLIMGPARADNITGGGVTGGSAFTGGGTFVDLSVPWGSVSSPADTVGDDNMNSSPNLFAFAEAQDYTLTSILTADVGKTQVPAGTMVNSDFVTFEPHNTLVLVGYVDFSTPVLAIITSDSLLTGSNYLGAPEITYLDPVGVGLEAVNNDSVTIDPSNPDQIDWNTTANVPGDSVRVITAATVPEPASFSLLFFGALLFWLTPAAAGLSFRAKEERRRSRRQTAGSSA